MPTYPAREKIASGRFINDSDYQHNARVCVIGQDLVEKLFPMVDPLDKEVLLAGIPFRVVGVMERVGSTFGQSQDNFAFVPLTTFRAIWMGRPELFVFIKAPDGRHLMELEDVVRALMRAHAGMSATARAALFRRQRFRYVDECLAEPDGHRFSR